MGKQKVPTNEKQMNIQKIFFVCLSCVYYYSRLILRWKFILSTGCAMMEREISANNNFGDHETSSVNIEKQTLLVIQIKYSETWEN